MYQYGDPMQNNAFGKLMQRAQVIPVHHEGPEFDKLEEAIREVRGYFDVIKPGDPAFSRVLDAYRMLMQKRANILAAHEAFEQRRIGEEAEKRAIEETARKEAELAERGLRIPEKRPRFPLRPEYWQQ